MPERKLFIGVDLGATTIKSGVVDESGRILVQQKLPTEAHRGPQTVIANIQTSIQSLIKQSDSSSIIGIGIGAPGIVTDTGVVKAPPNMNDWHDVPLRDELKKIFPYSIIIENDANAAAIAEAKFGAGTDLKDFVFIIWGTGVGGGIILDRKIFRGPTGGAGEVGHISIDYNGPLCNCGNRGCIESYIGQRYLSQRTKALLQIMKAEKKISKIEELVGGNLDSVEPYIIAQAAEQGDETAREILKEAGQLLGYALASVVNLLDIEHIIIGGGISAAPAFVFQAIAQGLSSRVLTPHRTTVKVLRAKLGNDAGIIGAASLVM
jgi:glucokinase